MELIISIDERNLDYALGKTSGRGLDNLIKKLGQVKFDQISLSGESGSYTFLRQVALMLNMLIALKQAKVSLSTNSFKRQGALVVPIYK